mmetsp:Transcript_52164/g.144428  ORF Transcript_52164/g.144428 Transcript_52164/m.144428 type:complete len:252 (-) Transcript_52164:723-1478(-)
MPRDAKTSGRLLIGGKSIPRVPRQGWAWSALPPTAHCRPHLRPQASTIPPKPAERPRLASIWAPRPRAACEEAQPRPICPPPRRWRQPWKQSSVPRLPRLETPMALGQELGGANKPDRWGQSCKSSPRGQSPGQEEPCPESLDTVQLLPHCSLAASSCRPWRPSVQPAVSTAAPCDSVGHPASSQSPQLFAAFGYRAPQAFVWLRQATAWYLPCASQAASRPLRSSFQPPPRFSPGTGTLLGAVPECPQQP